MNRLVIDLLLCDQITPYADIYLVLLVWIHFVVKDNLGDQEEQNSKYDMLKYNSIGRNKVLEQWSGSFSFPFKVWFNVPKRDDRQETDGLRWSYIDKSGFWVRSDRIPGKYVL